MNKFVKGLITISMVIVILFMFAYTVLALYVRDFSTISIIKDGFGRVLHPTPILIRIILQEDFMWAGYLFFLLDLIVFYIGFSIAYILGNLLHKKYEEDKNLKQ